MENIIEVTITTEDYAKASGYCSAQNCPLACAINRITGKKSSCSSAYVRFLDDDARYSYNSLLWDDAPGGVERIEKDCTLARFGQQIEPRTIILTKI